MTIGAVVIAKLTVLVDDGSNGILTVEPRTTADG
jgi:hypothetical protein